MKHFAAASDLRRFACFLLAALASTICGATETENQGIRISPAPGKVTVDGKADDWNLSGGVFVCNDVETLRDKLGVWFHAMYDGDNLYFLARFLDETPLNNPGSSKGDYGFAGDCLQVRTITRAEKPEERGQHFTAWRDREGIDVVKVEQGTRFDEGVIENAKPLGVQQAFVVNSDGQGYVQELAIPWKLLTRDGRALNAGDVMTVTVEPNFTIGAAGRLSLKDIFKPGVTPDRVFTFTAFRHWGPGSLEAKGDQPPPPLRLADAREFPVTMREGLPVIDWTGLIQEKTSEGFESITFSLPDEGYVSLNLFDRHGHVVRQLLSCEPFPRGRHEVRWDGLTTPNWRQPGEVVPPGNYTWEAIWHRGIGLRLRGWAANGGRAPWDGRLLTENWGGDHGVPAAVATDQRQVYLGWSGAEAGKALLACDLQGNVLWKNSRAGMAGAELVDVDRGVIYVQHWKGNLYRLEPSKGNYTIWQGSDSTDLFIKDLWGDEPGMPGRADALDACQGRLYLSFTEANLVAMLDADSGRLLRRIAVPSPTGIAGIDVQRACVVSKGERVLVLESDTGKTRPLISGLKGAHAMAVDGQGRLYVGLRDPDNQVRVFSADGKPLQSIGRRGGRALLGPWQADGMRSIADLGVDAKGELWVAEADSAPKRFSVWDPNTGKLIREFFGPSTYGALGGGINPRDPNLMVGQGCEWRLDPQTGRAACLGTIHRGGMQNARFGQSANGRLYLAIATRWAFDIGPLHIYERLGDADYKLRTTIFFADKNGKEIPPPAHGQTGDAAQTAVWSDVNGDSRRQPNEISYVEGLVRLSGWYMGMTPDMTFHITGGRFRVAGFTACGAPRYDLAHPDKLPEPDFRPTGTLGSVDGRLMLYNGPYGVNHGQFVCFDIATGTTRWTYPDNFVGVHGSHNAVPPQTGMIRGSFGPCGTARLPDPVGCVWVIPTNVGEWHLLTERGFYLTRLFQGDPLKVQWPEQAVPGVVLDNVPPGLGGEDFGGSIAQGPDGRLYVQAGKTGFWNLEVTGLDTIRPLNRGRVNIAPQEKELAAQLRDRYRQAAVGRQRMTIRRQTPTFSGRLKPDFASAEIIRYKKQDDAAVQSAAAWDDKNLYLAWDVKDSTPWMNGATDVTQMYTGGDTVDFQLGADPQADKERREAVAGDLRVSIGNFQGQPQAVLYRKASDRKKPKTFSSGVIREYTLDFVDVIAAAKIEVKLRPGNGYLVQAAIPWNALDLQPASNLTLRGDFGVTHGDAAGGRTRVRTYWNNQHTGIVDDAVFELKMEPRHWGELILK